MRDRIAFGALAALVLALLGPVPAQAATTTTIEWVTEAVTVDYGAAWHAELRVDRAPPDSHDIGPVPVVGTDDGTIDVYLDGGEEPWAAGLPVFEGGSAYVSQPRDGDPLSAGEHELRAVFVPSEGSDLAPDDTAAPLRITIAAFPIAAVVESIGAPEDDSLAWEVALFLRGEWVERNGAVPTGIWRLRLLEGSAHRLVETRHVAVERAAGAAGEPVRFERLRDATTYTVEAVFEPSPVVAGGLELEQPAPVSHTVRGSIGAILDAPLTVQVPVLLAAGAVLLLLLVAATALVVLLVRTRVRTTR